jgi:hypothetical protein
MLLLPRVMLLRHWQMLLLLRQMPHKLLQTLLQPLLLLVQRFLTLLTQRWVTFLRALGQALILPLRWGPMVKSSLPTPLVLQA